MVDGAAVVGGAGAAAVVVAVDGYDGEKRWTLSLSLIVFRDSKNALRVFSVA